MKRAVFYIRIVAYSAGLAGTVALMHGRSLNGPWRDTLVGAGGVLLGIMFVLFCANYFMHMTAMFRR